MDARPLTIVDVARFVARYWYIAIACFVAFLAPFVYHAYTAPAVYRATVVMAPASPTSQSSGIGAALGQLSGLARVAGIAGIGDNQGAEIEEALAIMHSRAFTGSFLEEVQAEGIIAGASGPPAAGAAGNSARTKLARLFDGSVRSVAQDKKTGFYKLSMDWTEPVVAAAWANQTVTRLNAVMRARAIERASANQRYLQEEAAHATQADVRNALSRLLESEIRQIMLAKVTPEFAFRVIDPATPPELDEKISPNRRKLVIAGALFAAFASLMIVTIIGTLRARPWRDRAA